MHDNITTHASAIRAKLAKVLALTGSSIDAEALAAARAAHRLLESAGLGWDDLLGVPGEGGAQAEPRWRQDARRALKHLGLLHPRDISFLHGLLAGNSISAAQAAWLADVMRKVEGTGRSARRRRA